MRSCKQQVTVIHVIVWEIIQAVVWKFICSSRILVWVVRNKLTEIVIFRKVIIISLLVAIGLKVVDLLIWLLLIPVLVLMLLSVLAVLVLLPCNLKRVVRSLNRH